MEKLTPQHHTGKAIDAASSREFHDQSQAQHFFKILQQRLAAVNSWHELAGSALAKFKLVDSEGQSVNREPLKGDHLMIDIPGPGSIEGDGYDWVQIETVQEQTNTDSESYGFTVRPSSNPNTPTTETAHFYSDETTSTFLVRRDGTTVTAEVRDRNTQPNKDALRTVDTIRDTVVAVVGLLMFSKIQWQSFTDGLISEP
jgi:hypothetical protein